MASLLSFAKKKIEDFIDRSVAQANPFDNGKTWQNPQGNRPQPQVPQGIRNAKYGVLANNPQAQQRFIEDIQPEPFNPLKASIESVAEVGKDLYQGTMRSLPRAINEVQSFQDKFTPGPDPERTYTPGSRIEKAIFGDETVKGFSQAGNEAGINSPVLAPVVGAAFTGLDFAPGGKAGKTPLKATLSKANKVDDVIKALNKSKEVNLTKSVTEQIAPAIAKTTDTKAIQNILDVASKPKEVPNLTPELPIKPPDVNLKLSQAAETERNLYKVSKPEEIKSKLTNVYDPYSPLVKIDKQFAKSQGIKYRDLPASQRLDYLADTSAYSARQADQMIQTPTKTGESVANVIQRYGEGTPEGKEFNNYLNSRFALEVAQKRNKDIIPNVSRDDLARFVQDYEARNPRAVADATTIKAHSDTLLDEAASGGLIGKADADFVKQYYQNYTPLSRVISENLQRPEIGGKSLGSIGRQRVLQKIEGGQQPLDDSFNAIVSRTNTAVSQANKARLARAYLERAQKGVAPGKLLVGAGNKAARKEERSQLKYTTQARNLAEQQALKEVKSDLKTTVQSPDARAAIPDLTRQDALSILPNVPTKKAQEISSNMASSQQARKALKENIAQLQDDPTTGKQVISGLVDGEAFKLEVPPEIAKVLQGLDERKFDAITQGMGKVMKVYQTAWTGFLNPVFSGISFAFYDLPMSIINSKEGFKTLGARAIGESLKSLNGNSEFQKALAKSGSQLVGGSQLPQNVTKSAEAIAARKNLFSKIKFNAKNPSEALQSLDVLGGKLANVTRTRVAKATELGALKRGLSKEEALAEAAYAYNNVLPNYGRISHLVRGLNSYIPYTGASIAGTRAMASALRNNPATSAKLLGVGIAPMVGAAAYTLHSEEGQEFINDMVDSKKQYILDNNFVIVLPGASKNSETGEWTGVLKIPVSPELRALNKIAWHETNRFIKGQNGASPTTVASGLFDFMTGGLRTSENPVVQTAEVVAGIDPRTGIVGGKKLVEGDLAEKPKSEQEYKSTSENAKRISKLLGGSISPIQADAILGQFSTAGQLVQNKGGNPVASLKESVERRFTGAYGKKDTTKFFENLDSITKGIEDPDDRKTFVALHSKDPNPGILDSAEKAMQYLNRPAVVEAERKLDAFNRKQGKAGNPLFDLSDDQLQKVLAYRSAKMLNAGKQTYDKNGNPLFTSLGLDEPWYEGFRSKETAFYDTFKKKTEDSDPKTFSGAPKVKASAEVQAKLDQYYKLQKGTGERSRFLRANPDILAYWEQSDGFTNKERAAIGLKPLEDQESQFASSGGRRSGSSGGGRSKEAKFTIAIPKTKAITMPKDIKVKKVAYKKAKTKKLPVSKLPKIS